MCNKTIQFYHSAICISMFHLCIGLSIPSVFIIILVAAILEQGDIKPLYIVMVLFFVLVSVIIFWWWNIKNINHFSVSEFLYECVPVVWMSFIISFSIKPLILAGEIEVLYYVPILMYTIFLSSGWCQFTNYLV